MHPLVDGQYQRETNHRLGDSKEAREKDCVGPLPVGFMGDMGRQWVSNVTAFEWENPRKFISVFDPILEMLVSPEKSINTSSTGERIEIPAATDVSFTYGIPNASNKHSVPISLRGIGRGLVRVGRNNIP